METITIFVHGLSKGNPGPAAVGVQIINASGEVLVEISESIGNAPDEYAEYSAVVRGLQAAADFYDDKTTQTQFEIKLSNESVKKQLNNEEIITNPGLISLFLMIHNMRIESFPNLTLTHVSGELNKTAAQLVKETLDAQ
jgi:ribonuclease HI